MSQSQNFTQTKYPKSGQNSIFACTPGAVMMIRPLLSFLFLAVFLNAQAQTPELTLALAPAAGFYENTVTVKMSSEDAKAAIYYTLDGSAPTSKSTLYRKPFEITQTTAVRAVAFRENRASDIATQTYIINGKTNLPVISICVKPYQLFHESDGLFSKGPGAKPNYPFYGANFWSRRELPAHIEYFETNGQKELDEDIGLSVFGGMSRTFPQKSLALAARKRYGGKYMKHSFFPNRPQAKYKHIVLRNGGSDFCSGVFRDDMITSLAQDAGMEVQASRATVCYINGVYWGIYMMREKLNRYFIGNHFDVNRDSIDFIEHRQDIKRGSIKHYQQLRLFLRDPANNFNDPAKFAVVENMMDVDNFLNHQVVEIYVDNQDAGGNIKFFRPQTPTGKWKWVLFDTDFGFSFYEKEGWTNNTLELHTDPDGPIWPNPPWSTLNLRELLENDGFRNKFINRFADMINTAFHPDHVKARIDSLKNAVGGEMENHFKRWKRSIKAWYTNLERMYSFGNERPAQMYRFLDEKFGCGQTVPIHIKTTGGKVLVNDFVSARGDFSGLYFANIPIQVKAVPDFGFRFTGWKLTPGDPKVSELNVSLADGPKSFEVAFERIKSPLRNKVMFTEITVIKQSGEAWLEIYNSTSKKINLGGWKLSTQNGVYALTEALLGAGQYAVICRDSSVFKKQYPDIKNILFVQAPGLTLRLLKESLQLGAADGAAVDSTGYQLIDCDGFPCTFSLLSPKSDNGLASSWTLTHSAGTPGYDNPGFIRLRATEKSRQWLIGAFGLLAIAGILYMMYRIRQSMHQDNS